MTNIRPSADRAYRSLKGAGFDKRFVHEMLPPWWSDDVLRTSAGMLEFAGLLQRRIGVSTEFSVDGMLSVAIPRAEVRFKQRTNIDETKIQITVGLARAIAKLALSRLPPAMEAEPPADAATAREKVLRLGHQFVSLDALLDFSWSLGIPVLRLGITPRVAHKAFGYSFCIQNRHAIVIGLDDDRDARVSFIVAHELGHIGLGHVASGVTLVDEVVGVVDETLEHDQQSDDDEIAADRYAMMLLRGTTRSVKLQVPTLASASQWATAAIEQARKTHVDPGHLILSHAFHTRNWTTGTLAYRFLLGATNARESLRRRYVDALGTHLSPEEREYLDTAQQYR